MRQVLLIVDVQSTFSPPEWLIDGIRELARHVPSVATIELHDETQTPFQSQLGWCPAVVDQCLVEADEIFVKHGYAPSPATIEYLKKMNPDRVLVCGIQTDTCVLAAGFALFDAGLHPTLVTDLTAGSSLDRSGQLGIRLWKHHFRQTILKDELLDGQSGCPAGMP
ncbi:IS66 family transposase ISPpu30 [Cupriavidus laharis]|uniref:IS66 family transposase ISPpu30 n=1 Tax=Cupriavidus laharis TaxID=151654 RepID=A0ABM8XC33_9BURK|nr:isochorismatase family protein [Cupriavidus laharis]CAG9177548.1 IS66 family transposase ISPpu30 [Cupriavidus laharis]